MFLFFSRAAFLLLFCVLALGFPTYSQPQTQGFQSPFTIQSYPQPFLPGWYANDLRATSSRVFRLATGGINGSVALAVQPISSFTGKVWVRLSPKGMSNPRVIFGPKPLKMVRGLALLWCIFLGPRVWRGITRSGCFWGMQHNSQMPTWILAGSSLSCQQHLLGWKSSIYN